MQNLGISGTADNDEDNRLMHLVASGDEDAFRQLMQTHLGRVVRMAARVMGSVSVAEDIAQEAFVRVWRTADKWNGTDKSGARFTTWLYRVVMNLCIDEKRKKQLVFSDTAADFEVADHGRTAEDHMAAAEQSGRVKAALAGLPDRQRQAFILCFYEEKSNQEAAAILDISVKALESLLVRSRRHLRAALQGERQ